MKRESNAATQLGTKVDLEVDIPVERFAVFAELAFFERRPELGGLCRAARAGGDGLTPAIVDQALPGLHAGGVRNILEGCRHLGLCSAEGALTPAGAQAAKTDEVPVPEQGVYELWAAEHPLLGCRILHARRLRAHRNDPRDAPTDALPLSPERHRPFTSIIEPGQRLLLRGFPSSHGEHRCVRLPPPPPLTLCWTWDMAQGLAKGLDNGIDRWVLRGQLEVGASMAQVDHARERASVDVWALLAEVAARHLATWGAWDAGQRRLAVSDETLTADEQEWFCKSWDLAGVEIARYGTFQRARLARIPLRPRTAAHAAAWARARFDRRLDSRTSTPAYLTRQAVLGHWDEIVRDTPLESFAPAAPAYEDLLAAADRPARYWSLAAPADLAPASSGGAP